MIPGHLLDNPVLDGRSMWKREANCCHEGKYNISLWGWIQVSSTQPSCSQTEWKVTVSMSKVLKIFWHAIAQWSVSTTTSKATEEQEKPEDPSPAWGACLPVLPTGPPHPLVWSVNCSIQKAPTRVPGDARAHLWVTRVLQKWKQVRVNHLINTCRNEHFLSHKGNQLKRKRWNLSANLFSVINSTNSKQFHYLVFPCPTNLNLFPPPLKKPCAKKQKND